MIAGEVERHGAAVRVLTDAGPGEDRLDEHGPGEHVREDEPDDGHDRRQGGSEDVTNQDVLLGEALRAGGAHVVVADHLEHRGARYSG